MAVQHFCQFKCKRLNLQMCFGREVQFLISYPYLTCLFDLNPNIHNHEIWHKNPQTLGYHVIQTQFRYPKLFWCVPLMTDGTTMAIAAPNDAR